MNVLNDDTDLYDSLTDNHKAAALVAILCRHHLDKLTDKNMPKIARDFLKKLCEGEEKTGIITDVIDCISTSYLRRILCISVVMRSQAGYPDFIEGSHICIRVRCSEENGRQDTGQ